MTIEKHTLEFYDYFDIEEEVERILSIREGRNVKIRDYAGKFADKVDNISKLDKPYQDFWHFWLKKVEDRIHNPSYHWISFPDTLQFLEEDKEIEEWQLMIFKVFMEVLPEENHEECTIRYEW